MKDTRKRVSLYFNMEDEEEKALFEFLDTKKKNKYLKRLIENDMHNNPSTNEILVSSSKESVDIPQEDAEMLEEIDFEMEGMDFDE